MRTARRSAPSGRRPSAASAAPVALPRRAPLPAPHTGPVLDVVVPVHNEETDLEPCVRRLHAHLGETFPYSFRITIADNASTDRTPLIAARLADELPGTEWIRLAEKGRGRALHAAWSRSRAPVLAYLDVDLSTDLAALLPLVAPLISGHSDIAIGTRLARGSRVVRGPKREFISRCYNGLLRGTLAVGFSDAQCGFKAVRRDVAERLLPLVQDREWFFDTEMLVIAERAGLRIHEVPVDWVDDPDSRVDILATALADLRGMARLGRTLAGGRLPLTALRRTGTPGGDGLGLPPALVPQLLRFAAVGVACTLFHLLLFTSLRPLAGAQAANALALLASAVANTAANRRLTFGVRGRGGALRHQLKGLAAFLVGLALTSGSLAVLQHTAPDAGARVELVTLVAANLAATLLRFLLLRAWVFPGHRSRRTTGASVS
ncbi:bifunctional glycosyltransferase family 2/GtrA family protein [Streptomyces sp. SBST2-5]|uniref:dolichyl-phosphate beta-glucosyltransferase n=1 Tax=Streptomyces composti TaxID=2720025 RepID=A0ABX1AA55_9ACTN|nr:bifunctional glycosyltransferase family 2/GtrA family protein [Streptomyces composti]NJP52047.1 bifunctional glycosyltransferase family 2/GtrA family protein [Streptomyces composti]